MGSLKDKDLINVFDHVKLFGKASDSLIQEDQTLYKGLRTNIPKNL